MAKKLMFRDSKGNITELFSSVTKEIVTEKIVVKKIVGDLEGTADKAVADHDDNNIADTYATKEELSSSTASISNQVATKANTNNPVFTGTVSVPALKLGDYEISIVD